MVLFVLLVSAVAVAEEPEETIDVVIALDTSNSMKGLINVARLKLWEIVYDLSLMEPTPSLRVALLTYGNSKGGAETGWVSVETDFTEDLDLVSERLFELTSDGAVEYLGRVLQTALDGGLHWTPSEAALKLIFVAGNEPADQDEQVDLGDVSDLARREGVSIHLIYCGVTEHEDAQSWKDFAEMAQGGFAAINPRIGAAVPTTPFDNELAKLSAAINETFLPMGDEGRKRRENLTQQDRNAETAGPAAVAGRARVKSSSMYVAPWDLVEALDAGEADLYEIEESELPEALRAMSFGEREAYIDEMRLERATLRQRIVKLGEERRQFVARQIESKGIDNSRAFDTVVRQAIREKAKKNGFRFPER
ncbi:MAG: VWA domain-containing protein [Acidobacteriota bacterium]|nr:VWA domain-containing protein [Acidobacteriota bacterium]MDH3786105.1 VWA domain-containing protein [Acidobacteriota bacterium]